MESRVYFSQGCYWDKTSATIVKQDKTTHMLSQKEEALLNILIPNAGAVVTHELLIEKIWGLEKDGYLEQSLRDLISRVKKIDPSIAACIISRKGIGYQYKTPQIPKQEKSAQKNAENTENIVCHKTLEELAHSGMTAKEIAKMLVANDRALYGDLGECEGEPETWQRFMECYPQTFQFLVDSQNHIIGNWSLLAPSAEHIELIEAGNIQEGHFSPADTECLLIPQQTPYVGYLLNFSVNQGFQTPENIKHLFDSFCKQLLDWAHYGIFFSKFYVNCFRGDHGKMFMALGFTKLVKNHPHGTIYVLDLTQCPAYGYWSAHKELRDIYHEYFSTITNK